jgi:hypothetical protein
LKVMRILHHPLTSDEAERLLECETVIEKGFQTFTEVGNVLSEIRDKRLYRQSYETFEDYCRGRWNKSKTHVNRLIAAAEVVRNLTPMGVIPASERQIRPLAKLEPDAQRGAWEEATKTNPNPSARDVEQAVKTVLTADEIIEPVQLWDKPKTAGYLDRSPRNDRKLTYAKNW